MQYNLNRTVLVWQLDYKRKIDGVSRKDNTKNAWAGLNYCIVRKTNPPCLSQMITVRML